MHHRPKADNSTSRGHGSLNGNADMTIKLSIDNDNSVCTGILMKNRNGPSNEAMSFTIKSCNLGRH